MKQIQHNIFCKNTIDLAIKNQAITVFFLLFLFLSLNSIYNSFAAALGFGFPYSTFVFNPSDLFADYFKSIFSFPQAKDIQIYGSSRLSRLLFTYLHSNPYQGVVGLAKGSLTHLHGLPLGYLYTFINIKLMNYIDPVIVFSFMLVMLFIATYLFISDIVLSVIDRRFFMLSILIAYPTLLVITRGHIVAALTTLALIAYVVLYVTNKGRYLALFLFAVVINIRPNAIIFVFLLLIDGFKLKIKELLFLISISIILCLSSYYIVNLIYPDYNVVNALKGLKIYHDLYVVGNSGLGYGSSLYGPMKLIFGATSLTEFTAMLIAGILLFLSIIQKLMNKISNSAFVFIVSACYVLGSSVIADYYLSIFIVPLLIYYLEYNKKSATDLLVVDRIEFICIFFGSIFMLIPKNYIFYHGISFQVLLNPIVLLILTVGIIYYYWVKKRPTSNIC